jgi:hypothetical protein
MVLLSGMARNYSLRGTREADWREESAIDRGGFRLFARYLSLTGQGIAVPFTFQDYGSSGSRLWADDVDSDEDDPPSGFIFASAEKIAEEWNGNKADAEACLRRELSDWGAYVEGNVVGFVVRDPETGQVLESCWGFYPEQPNPERRREFGWIAEHAHAIEEANSVAEYLRHERDVEEEPQLEEAHFEATR